MENVRTAAKKEHYTFPVNDTELYARPLSDMETRRTEIYDFCRHNETPVFLTADGGEDLVLMSRSAFDNLASRFRLYALLEEGMESMKAGKGIPAREAYERLKAEMKTWTDIK